jgi:hypothetical protein
MIFQQTIMNQNLVLNTYKETELLMIVVQWRKCFVVNGERISKEVCIRAAYLMINEGGHRRDHAPWLVAVHARCFPSKQKTH